jgi:hypothetical protein
MLKWLNGFGEMAKPHLDSFQNRNKEEVVNVAFECTFKWLDLYNMIGTRQPTESCINALVGCLVTKIESSSSLRDVAAILPRTELEMAIAETTERLEKARNKRSRRETAVHYIKLKRCLSADGVKRLYTILKVADEHWAAFVLDKERKEIFYGTCCYI